MRNTLTSIAEHSDWLETTEYWYNKRWLLHRKRVEFGKQPLAIWQFVPCKLVDGVWIVLESYYKDGLEYFDGIYPEQLKQAKSRCIFEGFEITYTDVFVKTISKGRERNCFKINFKSKNVFIHRDRIVVDTIEDLVKYNLELTASAIKELGL